MATMLHHSHYSGILCVMHSMLYEILCKANNSLRSILYLYMYLLLGPREACGSTIAINGLPLYKSMGLWTRTEEVEIEVILLDTAPMCAIFTPVRQGRFTLSPPLNYSGLCVLITLKSSIYLTASTSYHYNQSQEAKLQETYPRYWLHWSTSGHKSVIQHHPVPPYPICSGHRYCECFQCRLAYTT